jgi:hypothetical protein
MKTRRPSRELTPKCGRVHVKAPATVCAVPGHDQSRLEALMSAEYTAVP